MQISAELAALLASSPIQSAFCSWFLAMLLVGARSNATIARPCAISLAVFVAVALALVTIRPGRGEESPAYAIEVSDVTVKVGERTVMQATLRVRDGYRILQSYNNRVTELSAEDDGVAFEREMVRARIEEGALVFSVPLRATKPGRHPVNGLFRVGFIHYGGDEIGMVSLRLIASVTGTE
jgi:hypothetical protein